MFTITAAAITVMAITVVATTVVVTTAVAMVTLIGTTLILITILIIILMLIPTLILILFLSASAGVVGKGVAIVAAKARFDRAGSSRHGLGAFGAAGAAIFLRSALSAGEIPWAPGQCASSRKAEARDFAASLWSRSDVSTPLNRAINA